MTPVESRFWSQADDSANETHDPMGLCILWRGKRHTAGAYGLFRDGGPRLAHVWLYEHVHGKLPPQTRLKRRCLGGPTCVIHWAPERWVAKPAKRRTRLRPEQVREARALRASGAMTTRELARRFRVSESTMSRALRGLSHRA